jgi:hypothetical protein
VRSEQLRFVACLGPVCNILFVSVFFNAPRIAATIVLKATPPAIYF